MPIVDYPTGLGTVLMTKSRSQAATFSMSEPKSGPGYTKNTSVDVPVFWDATFKFTAVDAQRFHAWFMGALNRGRNPFNMLLSTEFGNVPHVCQFMPDSLLPQSREANIHTYTAQIRSEAIKYPPYIEENFDFVASEFWLLRSEWDYALNSLTPVIDVPSNPLGTTAAFTSGLYYDNATPVDFSDLVTFSRLSAGSYIDTDGVLKTAAIGEPRFEAGGLLVEPNSTNVTPISEGWAASNFASPAWAHSSPDSLGWITVTGGGKTGVPEGSYIDFASGAAVWSSTSTFSLDIKKNAPYRLRIRSFNALNPDGFGTVSLEFSSDSTIPSHPSLKVVDMGDWLRITHTRTFGASGTSIFRLYPFGSAAGASGSLTYRRVQVEKLPYATSYIKTTGVSVTRASDSAAVDMRPHTAGTIFAEFLSDAVAIERVVYTAGAITLKRLATEAISVTADAVTVTSAAVPAGSVKTAISYDGVNLNLAVNGVTYSASSALSSVGVSIALGNTTFANVWQRSEAYDNARLIEVTQ